MEKRIFWTNLGTEVPYFETNTACHPECFGLMFRPDTITISPYESAVSASFRVLWMVVLLEFPATYESNLADFLNQMMFWKQFRF